MRALVTKPPTKLPIMMMIGISWLAIIFSLSAGQEIDRSSAESNENGPGSNRTSTGGDDRLQVTIYYEALCYDSISFITNQLAPSWGRHRDYMDLKLVPFGKAYIDDSNPSDPVYYCQHGHRECTLNILHGCILDKLPFEKAFPVIACLMKGFRTSFEKCYKLDLATKEKIQKCANGEQGAKLFKKSSVETNNVATPLSFVPTIEIDKNYDIFEQDRWLYRFDKTFREEFERKFNETLE